MSDQLRAEEGINPEWECSPRQVQSLLQNPESGLVLVDCRTDAEWDQARIEGAVLIPLQEIHERVDELRPYDDARPLVVYCHHGRRSLRAAAILREAGLTGALSMAGGIDRWSVEIDASVPRYTK